MLNSLLIRNYALIKKLEVDFHPGFSIITGETGAGKSILLGALSLLIGQRADTTVLKDKSTKCIVEADFDIEGYDLEAIFRQDDVEYDRHTIIRREIYPNGKSRAFVNDTPVNLPFLKSLGEHLVDIHSQHHTLILNDKDFQLKLLDTLVGNENILTQYKESRKTYLTLKNEYSLLEDEINAIRADYDYLKFQFDELDKLKIINEDADLEEEYEALSHTEEIKLALGEALDRINGEEFSVLSNLKESVQELFKAGKFLKEPDSLAKRAESTYIELKDIAMELEELFEKQDVDPARLDEVRSRMDAITALYLKHKAGSIPELIDIREQFRSKLETIELGDDNLKEIRLKLERARDKLTKLADELHTGRQKIIPSLEKKMKETMAELGMVHAVFKIDLKKADDFLFNGIDVPDFLFSANGGMDLKLISKVASGGELSRLMLSLKAIVADKLQLPTIIFDEIDSGVSGEIADKVGNIILKMSQNLQVFNITHLPQVASKGKYHYKVYKYDDNGETLSHIKLLDKEERRKEIAQMLSGENLTGAALSNADELLGY